VDRAYAGQCCVITRRDTWHVTHWLLICLVRCYFVVTRNLLSSAAQLSRTGVVLILSRPHLILLCFPTSLLSILNHHYFTHTSPPLFSSSFYNFHINFSILFFILSSYILSHLLIPIFCYFYIFLRIIFIIVIIPPTFPFSSSYQLHVVARLALVHVVPVLALTLRNVASLAIHGVTARIPRRDTSWVWLLT
jgi:hypothetical protein